MGREGERTRHERESELADRDHGITSQYHGGGGIWGVHMIRSGAGYCCPRSGVTTAALGGCAACSGCLGLRPHMHQALGYVLAAFIGLSLGALGGGGSILTVPIFVFVMGDAPKLAIAMSLPVVGATSLFGAIGHWRNGTLRLHLAATFGLVAMIGAIASPRAPAYVAG